MSSQPNPTSCDRKLRQETRSFYCTQHDYSAVCWPCLEERFRKRGEQIEDTDYGDGFLAWKKLKKLGCDPRALDEYLYRAFLDAVIWKRQKYRGAPSKPPDKDPRVRKFARAPKLLHRLAQTLSDALAVAAIQRALLRAGYTLPLTGLRDVLPAPVGEDRQRLADALSESLKVPVKEDDPRLAAFTLVEPAGYGADVAHLEEFAKRLDAAIEQIRPVTIKPGRDAIRELSRFVAQSVPKPIRANFHDQEISDLLNATGLWFSENVGKRAPVPSEMYTRDSVSEIRRTRNSPRR